MRSTIRVFETTDRSRVAGITLATFALVTTAACGGKQEVSHGEAVVTPPVVATSPESPSPTTTDTTVPAVVPQGTGSFQDAESMFAQKRYKELLRDRDTFAIAEEKPRVYAGPKPLAFYREQADGALPSLVDELLAEWKLTRFNCPYVLVVVMNPKDHFPVGAAFRTTEAAKQADGTYITSRISIGRDGARPF